MMDYDSIARTLSYLRAQRTEIDAAIAALERLDKALTYGKQYSAPKPKSKSKPKSKPETRTFSSGKPHFGKSTKLGKLLRAIAKLNGRAVTAPEVNKILGDTSKDTGSALSRCYSFGLLSRTGTYRRYAYKLTEKGKAVVAQKEG